MALVLCTGIVDGVLCGHPSRELTAPTIRLVLDDDGEALCTCHPAGDHPGYLRFLCGSQDVPCRCSGPYPCPVHPRPYAGSQGRRGRRPGRGLA